MATLHPSFPTAGLLGPGFYRERDVLELLEVGLPVGFDLFHSVDWSSTVEGRQQIGEIDIAVVSPVGHLLLIEVKSGALEEGESGLSKRYAKRDEALDVGRQLRRQHLPGQDRAGARPPRHRAHAPPVAPWTASPSESRRPAAAPSAE